MGSDQRDIYFRIIIREKELFNEVCYLVHYLKCHNMLESFENGRIPGDYDTFEMMVQWGRDWIGIVVIPVKDGFNTQHYVVHLPNDITIILRKNEWGEWEELKEGTTALAGHLGKAIENFYTLCN